MNKSAAIRAILELLGEEEEKQAATPPKEEEKQSENPPKAEETKEIEEKAEEVEETEPPKEEAEEEAGSIDPMAEIEKLRYENFLSNANSAIEKGFAEKGIDSGNLESIKSFIDYDKLTNDENALDTEKVKGLVDSFASLAMNTPPSRSNVDFTQEKAGIGQYLD